MVLYIAVRIPGRFFCIQILPLSVSLRRIASCEVHKDYPDYDEV